LIDAFQRAVSPQRAQRFFQRNAEFVFFSDLCANLHVLRG